MNVDLSFLPGALLGAEIPRPLSGTLSGHAAGEPFSKLVLGLVKQQYPLETYQQHEYLNRLYQTHPEANTAPLRKALIPDPALSSLLGRGRSVTAAWAPDSPFVEKQNDTADLLVLLSGHLNILDVKTRNTRLQGQAPNIISAFKLANACALLLRAPTPPPLSLIYIGINWAELGTSLRCTSTSVAELFKVPPAELYINWAATLQIQFQVGGLDQSYTGTVQEWCRDFLASYAAKAQARETAFRSKFIDPFTQYL